MFELMRRSENSATAEKIDLLKPTEQSGPVSVPKNFGIIESTYRPFRDMFWLILFAILNICCIGGALFAYINKTDQVSALIDGTYRANPRFCSNATIHQMFHEEVTEKNESTDIAEINGFLGFLKNGWICIFLSILFAIVIGAVLISLFFYFPNRTFHFLTNVTVVLPIAGGLVLYLGFKNFLGIVPLCVGIRCVYRRCCCSHNYDSAEAIVEEIADTFKESFVLVYLSLSLVSLLFLALVTFFSFLVLALTNGHFSINAVVDAKKFPEVCVETFLYNYPSQKVDCCVWNMDIWVIAYWILLVIMIVWWVFLFHQIKAYIVVNVVAQWYFKDVLNQRNITVMRSLKYACGPSLGSLVLASVILPIHALFVCVMSMLQYKLEKKSIIFAFLCFCMKDIIDGIVDSTLPLVEFITIGMSLSGESFSEAQLESSELNDDYLVNPEQYTTSLSFIVNATSAFISTFVSAALVSIAHSMWKDGNETSHFQPWIWVLFFICSLSMYITIAFFLNMIVNIVNTCFTCYAIDCAQDVQCNERFFRVLHRMVGYNPHYPITHPHEDSDYDY